MALNNRQLERNGLGQEYLGLNPPLLGFESEGVNLAYPVTEWQINNTLNRYQAAEAYEDAANEANYLVNRGEDDRQEAIEFANRTRIGSVVRPGKVMRAGKEIDFSRELRGYQYVLATQKGVYGLQFSAESYGGFDGIVVERSGVTDSGKSTAPAFNPDHPHYADFAPLRRNLAILRNYLISKDGAFESEDLSNPIANDLARLNRINQMADRLGSALASKSGSTPGFMTRWSNSTRNLLKGEELATPYSNELIEAANIPDKGAMVMYKYLHGLQESPSIKGFVSSNTPKNWNLQPTEETIFSSDNIRRFSRSSRMFATVGDYEEVMQELRAPERLTVGARDSSVDIARDILDKLRSLMANPGEQERQSMFRDNKQDESRRLLAIATVYKEELAKTAGAENSIDNPVMQRAQEAFEKLGYRMKVETYKALVKEYEPRAAKHLLRVMEQTPKKFLTDESTDMLLAQVDSGFQEIAKMQQRNVSAGDGSYDNAKGSNVIALESRRRQNAAPQQPAR